MLLIDGVKYELWTPSTEDEFERIVKEHAHDIFGEQSIYLDRKQKLRSLSGVGSIPDGYVITLGGAPQWHIIEVELSSHPLHDHVVSQLSRFIGGISNTNIQRGIVNAIDEEITKDDFLKVKLRKAIEPVEIHRFLTNLVSKPPILTIIIEKETEELREALNTLRYSQIKVVEFQTFVREGAEVVHAHLFEPLYEPIKKEGQKEITEETKIVKQEPPQGVRKVTAGDFTHNGNGVFALTSDPSVTIDAKKRERLVEQQLAKQGLWTKRLASFCWDLRRKVGLLNTPTED